MLLTPMRYKSYIWPHNPAAYSISYERQIAVNKVPMGRYYMQDLQLTCRVMRGWGEFSGEGAYEEFKKLASIFYDDGPGLLIHPVWQIANVYFTGLKLEQEPLPDYVRYSFEFQERFDGYQEGLTELGAGGAAPVGQAARESASYTVVSGDTLWGIALRTGTTLESLLAANPGIKNPNLIHVGDEVVIPC